MITIESPYDWDQEVWCARPLRNGGFAVRHGTVDGLFAYDGFQTIQILFSDGLPPREQYVNEKFIFTNEKDAQEFVNGQSVGEAELQEEHFIYRARDFCVDPSGDIFIVSGNQRYWIGDVWKCIDSLWDGKCTSLYNPMNNHFLKRRRTTRHSACRGVIDLYLKEIKE